MLKITLSALSAFAALLALSLIRDPAWAQSRVFVAAQGSDTNLCTFAAPCRTFQHAHDVVAANGEIDVLDPAGYGPITINKGISIQGHGFSGITATSGNAITINAGGADVVNLIGLIIEGAGLGSNGIVLNVGGSINIVDCMVRSFVGQTAGTGSGISISPVTGTTKFFIAHTIASDNTGNGILIRPAVGVAANGVITDVGTSNNGVGINAAGQLSGGVASKVTITSSTASGNIFTGVQAVGLMSVLVRDTTASNNQTGFTVSSADLRLSRVIASGNGDGVSGGPSVSTYGDNQISGNTTDVNVTLTPISSH
jgi:hypothetical protein